MLKSSREARWSIGDLDEYAAAVVSPPFELQFAAVVALQTRQEAILLEHSGDNFDVATASVGSIVVFLPR